MTEEKRFQWVYIKDNTLELRDNGIVKVFVDERLEEFLNDFHEENRLLQMKYDAQRELYGQLNSDYNNLREENQAYLTEIRRLEEVEKKQYEENQILKEKNEKILYFISEFQNKINDYEKKGILQIPNHIVLHILYSIQKMVEK